MSKVAERIRSHPDGVFARQGCGLPSYLLVTSRMLFQGTALLAMLTPSWEHGLFAALPVATLQLGARTLDVGVLGLLPAIIIAMWLGGRLLEKPSRPWRWGPAHLALPMLGFGSLVLLRTWPMQSLRAPVVAGVAILLFWVVYLFVLHNQPVRCTVLLLSAFLLIQGLVAGLQFARQSSLGLSFMGEPLLQADGAQLSVIEAAGRRWLRAYGLMPHPNVLGGYLAMGILACVAGLGAEGRAQGRGYRAWLGLCILAGLLGLGVSFSRSAWLGLLTGLAYLLALRRGSWRSLRAGRTRIVLWVVLLVVALVILVVYRDLFLARLLRLNAPLERRSLDERVEDTLLAWNLIRQSPYIGVGSGRYLDALWAGAGAHPPPGFRTVHNVSLLAAAELGIGGTVFWLWMLLAPPLVLWHRSRRASVPGRHAAWASTFVAAMVVSLFDSYLYMPVNWWPALFLGILAGTWARMASQGVGPGPGTERRHG